MITVRGDSVAEISSRLLGRLLKEWVIPNHLNSRIHRGLVHASPITSSEGLQMPSEAFGYGFIHGSSK